MESAALLFFAHTGYARCSLVPSPPSLRPWAAFGPLPRLRRS
jgi:hypothetical protein